MYVPKSSESSNFNPDIVLDDSLNWIDKLPLKKISLSSSIPSESGKVENLELKGTHFSCTVSSEAARWDNRKIYIKNILSDIIANCPKDEPLALVSHGSDRLLIEYILGKVLIEQGFSKISFFLIDPMYVFSNSEERNTINELLNNFREKIESIFLESCKEHLSKERIKFLSRAQNITKYFTQDHPNVVLIECLPPYSESIKDMKKYRAPEKTALELMVGSCFVPSSKANSITFIPIHYAKLLNLSPTDRALPLAIVKLESYYYLDWGCKIQSDGTFHLSFSGQENYLRSLGIPDNRQMKLETGEIIPIKDWIPTIKNAINKELILQIEQIKVNDSGKKELSQEKVTSLLEKIKEIVTLYMPGIQCFFSADYTLDHLDLITFLTEKAGHHYRKIFTLEADAENRFRITANEINNS